MGHNYIGHNYVQVAFVRGDEHHLRRPQPESIGRAKVDLRVRLVCQQLNPAQPNSTQLNPAQPNSTQPNPTQLFSVSSTCLSAALASTRHGGRKKGDYY